MKRILLASFIVSPFLFFGQTPCVGGMASGFPCDNLDLQSRITPGEMNAIIANDSWGWTDPDDGKEYAIVGLDNGTAFIDISDPVNPAYLGKLPTHTEDSGWRDIKVYNNHAFIVSEASFHGMQVFDLTRLRNVANPPETFTEDAHYDQVDDSHNIVINEDSGFAYIVGADFSGGAHFVNIQDPVNPVAAGGYGDDGYTHDAQVVTYNGPDTDYTGREIFIGCNTNEVVIVDVTDKNNPVKISATNYSNVGYTHQGWFTEDQRYFLLGDEDDEFTFGFDSRTIIMDFSDLDNPQPYFEYFNDDVASVDHNGYVKGDKFYLASYSAGTRVIDISDIANQNIDEVAYFDTYPADNNASFNGNWSVYPFFDSGNIVISGDAGFTLVIDPAVLATQDFDVNSLAMYPNPARDRITVASDKDPISEVSIYNVLGQKVLSFRFDQTLSKELDISSLNSGIYLVNINNITSKKLVVR